MVNVTRRGFLKLLGAAVTISAGGIALLEHEPIRKAYFLPPRGGWAVPGTWELACATEALRIVSDKLCMGPPMLRDDDGESPAIKVVTDFEQRYIDSLLSRHARLTERVDKLSRGWKGYSATYRETSHGVVVTHGGSLRASNPLIYSGKVRVYG